MFFRKVYQKYPYMKGYLTLDDDYFIKPWEFEDYDFKILLINEIYFISLLALIIFKNIYIYLDNQFNNNNHYNNISKSFGYNLISLFMSWIIIIS